MEVFAVIVLTVYCIADILIKRMLYVEFRTFVERLYSNEPVISRKTTPSLQNKMYEYVRNRRKAGG